jgi:hypothetical protein
MAWSLMHQKACEGADRTSSPLHMVHRRGGDQSWVVAVASPMKDRSFESVFSPNDSSTPKPSYLHCYVPVLSVVSWLSRPSQPLIGRLSFRVMENSFLNVDVTSPFLLYCTIQEYSYSVHVYGLLTHDTFNMIMHHASSRLLLLTCLLALGPARLS